MQGRLPNFLILGAAKAGTTSLYYYLAQHPQIFVSVQKEPKFFALKGCDLEFSGPRIALSQLRASTITSLSLYKGLFSDALEQQTAGEASPMYLHSHSAAQNIYSLLPNVRMIVILRNPIERAYSDWRHNYYHGYEPISDFDQAARVWPERAQKNWIPYANYIEKGLYAAHLTRYFDLFGPEQFSIHLFEDLAENAHGVLASIFDFLQVGGGARIDTTRKYMATRPISKHRVLHKALLRAEKSCTKMDLRFASRVVSQLRTRIEIPYTVSPKNYQWLSSHYSKDIECLEDILHRDLSGWLDPARRKVRGAKLIPTF